MRIETVSYLKKYATNLELRNEGIALLKLMNLAQRDITEGRTYSADEALDKLTADLTNGKVTF